VTARSTVEPSSRHASSATSTSTRPSCSGRPRASSTFRIRYWIVFLCRCSSAAAAAELHLHKNTIQYRIRKVEEARGRPLHDGRVDVEVALLACRLLGSTVLRAVT